MKAASLADAELLASLEAGAHWSATRDLPDAVGWADLLAFPEMVIPVLRERLAAGAGPCATQQFPMPKERLGELRSVTVADPFDEVAYRALTGRTVEMIDRRLGAEVKSYRLSSPPPAWTYRNHVYGHDERREEGIAFVNSDVFAALGVMDVRNYYPTVDLDRLAATLSDFGVPTSDVGALHAFVQAWAENWAVSGIPIGPEASGVLGNAMLVVVDEALRREGIGFSRYTDDLHLYIEQKSTWPFLSSIVETSLNEVDLEPNSEKTKCVLTRGPALRAVGDDPLLGELSRALRGKEPSALSRVKVMFDEELAKSRPAGRRVRFALGVLARTADGHAMKALIDDESVFRHGPKHWGDYLVRLHTHGKTPSGWLEAVAVRPIKKESACLQMHALRALGNAGHVSRTTGQQMETLATSTQRNWGPVRCAAADAWARSDGWKSGAATEAALAAGDVSQQRALTLSLRHGQDDRRRRRGLSKLRTASTARMSAAWVASGCPIVRR